MRAALALLLLAFAVPASAETHRVALVVGNNAGLGEQPPLHFAETDAGKMARVLVELGGVVPADLLLLQGRSLAELKEAFGLARARVAGYRVNPDDRVVLLFYFSGHSEESDERDHCEADVRRQIGDIHARRVSVHQYQGDSDQREKVVVRDEGPEVFNKDYACNPDEEHHPGRRGTD